MVLTLHLLLGAAIITEVKNIPLAFLLCILSHYFLDFLPHKEYPLSDITEKCRFPDSQNNPERKFKGCLSKIRNLREFLDFYIGWKPLDFLKVFLDFSFGVLLLFLLSRNFLLALSGGILAISPDGLTFLYSVFPKNNFLNRYYNFHKDKVHFFTKKKIPLFWRTFSQLIVFVLSVFLLIS